MAKRRNNGEGSWGKKTIKGEKFFYYRDPDGHYTYGKTQGAVKEKLSKKKEQSHTVQKSNKLTLSEYMQSWLYNKKFKEIGITLEATTFDSYEASLQKRLYNYKIANMQVTALSKEAFTKYLKDLSAVYSRGSIQKTWQVIKMALTDDDFEFVDLIPQINFDKIRIPKEGNVAVKKKDHNFTSNEDMDKLYNEALRKNSKDGFVYGNSARLLAFIMYSGLRVGEAIGLKWKDVDLSTNMITINQVYSVTHNRDDDGNIIDGYSLIEKAPKTESSSATIPCRKRAIDILILMNQMYLDHKGDDIIFKSSNGTPLTKRHILHTLKRMLKATAIDKDYSVHDLRHGYGSILYKEGVDIMTISKLLRHKDIQTTANIYVRTTPETLKDKLLQVDGL